MDVKSIEDKSGAAPCGNTDCWVHNQKFEYNCRAKYSGGEPYFPHCEKYIPESGVVNEQ